jgi:exosortase
LIGLALDRSNSDLSHIVVVPFVSLALVYLKRKTIFAEPRTSGLPAMLGFAAGAVLYYASKAYASHFNNNDYLALTTASVVTLCLSGFMFFYGAGAFRAALFPLLFLVLAIPFPSWLLNQIVRFLQVGSAEVVSILFTLTGTPVYRSDLVFMLPGLTIEVAEACSGIRSTLGILIVTLLAAHIFLKSNWKKMVLVLVVIPISLFKNAVRIVALTLLGIHWDMGFITGRLHHEGGVVFMMVGLFLMYPVLALLIKWEAKNLHGVRI